MSLGKVDRPAMLGTAIDQWRDRRASHICDHGAECCAIAKSWFIALDRSRRASDSRLSGPRWVLERYPWGPNVWPIYWCDVARAEKLDCGALADLACLMFRARGVECRSVQLIQGYADDDTPHWNATWVQASRSMDWVVGPYSYHEACAVSNGGNEVRIWDPTDNSWISRGSSTGYAKVAAIRIPAAYPGDWSPLCWEGQAIERGVWQAMP